MKEVYYSDYQSEPIGEDNPYYCCSYCKRSDPEINGILEKHSKNCEYRINKERELAIYKELSQENERASKGWW
jgi:hypothetical protein